MGRDIMHMVDRIPPWVMCVPPVVLLHFSLFVVPRFFISEAHKSGMRRNVWAAAALSFC